MVDTRDELKTSPFTAKWVLRRIFRHENSILIIILAAIIGVLAVATGGGSITPHNIRNVFLQSSMRGIASVGQGFVLLCAYFDLSVGGLATMLTLLGATLMTAIPKHSLLGYAVAPGIGVPVMLVAGLVVGSVNGLSVSRLRMPALIVTLCMWQITNGFAYQIGRGWSVAGLPKSIAFFGQGEIAGIPVAIVLFIAVAAIAYYVLNHTTFGRSVYAVGGNPVSAYLSGIRVRRIVFAVFVICGFLTGLSSIIIMSRYMAASMLVALGFELDTIAACVIGGVSLFGGRGSLVGIVIGVLIIGFLNNGMNLIGVPPPVQEVVKGSIIIGAVAVDTLRRR